MKPYAPINCTYYDYIEHYAVLKQQVTIKYLDQDDIQQSVLSTILDTKNDGTAEYIIVKDLSSPIRLDQIIAIEDKVLADYTTCNIEINK